MLHEVEAVDQFVRAMAEHDIVVSAADIKADGKLHRVHVDGDQKGSRNGWYILHVDDKPAGAFGCNRRYGHTHKFTWTGKATKPLTPEERRAYRKRMEQQRREREAAEQQRREAAAELANRVWEAAQECSEHPYLSKKGVRSHGLRVGAWEIVDQESGEVRVISRQALLVPIRDTKKRIHSLQAIFPSKLLNQKTRDKDYLSGGAKEGLFYSIGKPQEHAGKPVILICEGYATGATLHECTGHAVLVAFDAGNLIHVARVIRERFPAAVVVMAADNDQWTLEPIKNPGVTRAREAAAEIGGLVAVPPIDAALGKADSAGKVSGPTDFNDLQQLDGPEAVRAVIDAALNPAPDAKSEAEPEAPAPDLPPWEGADEMPAGTGKDIDDDDGDLGPARNGYFAILGYDHERYFVFQHGKRQIFTITKSDMGETGLIELAPLNWWEMNFPGERSKIDTKAAANFLIRTAEKRGIYDISRIRGRGAWVDEGRIVYHHGGYLSVDGARTDITHIESKYVYELDRALPAPADDALSSEDGERLLDIANMFRWTKPGSAALLAGWVALAPLCGALRWRPHIWLTGGAGTGKTTLLNDYVHRLLGGLDLYAQGNSSEAGIRQTLKADALPVLFDESEQNDEREQNRVQGILALIRQASTESQARTLKGTAGGDAMSFHIRSMFCLASIQVGIKHQADVERMAVLALRPKREDPNAAATWEKLSNALYSIERDATLPARLFRRSLNLLPVTLKNIGVFAGAAAEVFGSQRDGDQYGTLLAGAWSLISTDVASREQALEMIANYDWSEHRENNDVDEGQRALAALLEAHIRAPGGVELTVYELVCAAYGRPTSVVDLDYSKADAILQRYGMRVKDTWLMLSNTSIELRKLVAHTSFESDLRGVLLRVEGADRNDNKPSKFNGVQSKCIRIPLGTIVGDGEGGGVLPF